MTVKAAEVIYAGALVMMDGSGEALAGAIATGQIAVGKAVESVDNTADGKTVMVEVGTHKFANDTGTAVVTSDIGGTCWILDDQTVSGTSNGDTRSRAGVVMDVDTDGVWVEVGPLSCAIAAASITATELANNSVDTGELVNLAVTTAKLDADAVDGTKLADNAVDSEHITAGAIDTAHIAADQIDGTLIADNAVDSEHYTDGSVDPIHLAADYRSVASDGALVLAVGDGHIELLESVTGTKAGTMTTAGMRAGQEIFFSLTAASGGSYTLAIDSGGARTITLDAADESCTIYFDGTDWRLKDLRGATVA
jgi:hypothetical protein